MTKKKKILVWLLSFVLLGLAWTQHSPYFIFLRHINSAIIIIFALYFLIRSKRYFPKPYLNTQARLAHLFFLGLMISSLGLTLQKEIGFFSLKQRVLNADPAQLQSLGRHFIVGYRDYREIERLVSKGAIGGVFITQRNIQGKSFADVQDEIAKLQKIQKKLGLPPLWIATDEEGGNVARLFPLIPNQGPLSYLVEQHPQAENLEKAVISYAVIQGKALYDLGVNLNFSPVVDLRGERNLLDLHSRIWERAISDDPKIVSQVSGIYCKTLIQEGIKPTLKHFPGLGKISEDTHVSEAKLNLSVEQLEAEDWQPFKNTLSQTQSFLMLSHAHLSAIDEENPVSVSSKVIQEIIRKRWQHSGVLITDDFTMAPIYSRQGGVGKAAVDALNAGVDLILISYDGELYYEAMDALLKADKDHRLNSGLVAQSDSRLKNQSTVMKVGVK